VDDERTPKGRLEANGHSASRIFEHSIYVEACGAFKAADKYETVCFWQGPMGACAGGTGQGLGVIYMDD
jgi:hypothetical protein